MASRHPHIPWVSFELSQTDHQQTTQASKTRTHNTGNKAAVVLTPQLRNTNPPDTTAPVNPVENRKRRALGHLERKERGHAVGGNRVTTATHSGAVTSTHTKNGASMPGSTIKHKVGKKPRKNQQATPDTANSATLAKVKTVDQSAGSTIKDKTRNTVKKRQRECRGTGGPPDPTQRVGQSGAGKLPPSHGVGNTKCTTSTKDDPLLVLSLSDEENVENNKENMKDASKAKMDNTRN